MPAFATESIQAREALKAFIPSSLVNRFDSMQGIREKNGSGKLELQGNMDTNLRNAMPLVSATKASVGLDAAVQIDDWSDKFELELNSDSLTMRFKKPFRQSQEPLERELNEAEQKFQEGEQRWKQLIVDAGKGNTEAIKKVVGSVWAVQFMEQSFDLQATKLRDQVKAIFPDWQRALLGNDHFGAWLMADLANKKTIFTWGSKNNINIASGDVFAELEKVFSPIARGTQEPRKNPQQYIKMMESVVDATLHRQSKVKLLENLKAGGLDELRTTLDAEMKESLPAEILAARGRLMADAAKLDRDAGRILAETAKILDIPDVKYDEMNNTLSLGMMEGVGTTLNRLNLLMDRAGKTIHADMGITIGEKMRTNQDESQLVPFNEVKVRVKPGMTIPPLVMGEIGLQAERGFIYQIFNGPGLSGKTTTAATVHNFLENALNQGISQGEPRRELPLVRPRENNPESILAAMRQTAWRLEVISKPSVNR
jgi:hypothetical protein